ncbi:MAG: FGGY-family carbohydrate kinase [Candidatus Thiodiazotropha sp.]
MDAFLGIDLGTSGCRGVVIERSGEVIAESGIALPPSRSTASGESRQDPADWWHAVIQLINLLSKACQPAKIQAIAVDGTSSTLLLCDEQGVPLTPALMYDDSSGREAVAELSPIAPAGNPVLNATSSLAKLLTLRKSIGPLRYHALHQADWVMGRLCGRFDLSDENNCLKLGYDPIERRWPKWLEGLALPAGCLPRVSPGGTPVGHLSQPIAGQLGLPSDTLIVTGTTDGNAAFLATGADQIGDAVTSLGSTLVLKILSRKPIFAAEYGVYSHRLGDRWLVSGASNSGGAVCRAFFSDAQIEQLSRQMKPERPTGLDYYPLLRPGERFPVNDSGLPPRLSPRPADDALFFQAILEGISRIEQEGYQLLRRLGAPAPKRVISIGGGAVNEPWRQMRQAALGVPVTRAVQQAAAYGAALLARQGACGRSNTM